ncbi:nicotinate-nucleotide pyrophosphorylase [Fistulifera solaris]|uniref:Nicotinate-nucleotide pyrophosphorylase [carboxylating] n=1 Tax=Fistulifera solaris TaxID=1519565 RepID=A0A1Z5KJ79_FISSO|nr:nicotinate-nucleotide pyrophosphorylase [Fistulifera solaris]|eukprot:GAX26195.1 nicotinate-nucleotide pyrophosphorylase [Fistulifera solaris]
MSSPNKNQQHQQTNDFFATLLPQHQIDVIVQQWLHDDMPSLDVGGLVVGDVPREATLWMKSPGVLAGKPFFETVFRILGCSVTWHPSAAEGVYLSASPEHKLALATVSGPIHKLLQGERTALNTLSRCSGVATLSQQAVTAARDAHWKGWVAGTRKTTPGFRIVEKYGLLVGGAATHRLDLSQMVMLKDNHIQSAGSIRSAIQMARQAAGFSQKIEVECSQLAEAMEAAQAGADIVMLDNLEPQVLKVTARMLKKEYPHVLIEASGGITTETMKDYLSDDVDIVSQGKLTQGYDCIDYSLKVMPPKTKDESLKQAASS